MASAQRDIKTGSGSNVRSAIYPEMGSLRSKPKGLSRANPFRGQKQRSRGGSR